MRHHPLFYLSPLLSLALTGCPMPYNSSPPMMSTTGYPGPMPAPMMLEGPSLDDAYHQVNRYLTLHYTDAKLLKVQCSQVSNSGRGLSAGAWKFIFLVQSASAEPATPSPIPSASESASPSVQAMTIPTHFDTQQLLFTVTGDGELLAPEADSLTQSQAFVDFARTKSLSQILKHLQGFGFLAGPAGADLTLRVDERLGAIYELKNGVPSYPGMATSAPDGYPYSKRPMPLPAIGNSTFVVRAYTGEIIDQATD